MLARGGQDFGSAQQASRMGVVATGVHPSGDGARMRAVHFLDGEGVHVGPEGHPPGAGFAPGDLGHDSGRPLFGAPSCGMGDAHVGQGAGHIAAGLRLGIGGLGMEVQVAAVGQNAVGSRRGGVEDGVFQHVTRSRVRVRFGQSFEPPQRA